MRLTQLRSRVLISLGVTLMLAMLLALPLFSASTDVQARPLQQTGPATPLLDPALNEQDALPGTTIAYTVDLENVGGSPATFNVTIEAAGPVIPGATATLSTPGPFDLGSGDFVRLTVFVTIPANAQQGQVDNRRLIATVANTNRSATALLVTTVVTATPTQTITPTSTGTAGPTPTPGPICRDSFEDDDSLSQAREIFPDAPQGRAICPRGDEDWAYFGATAGKVFTIDVETMREGLDLSLSLYDEVGNLLAFNDDFPRDNNAGDIRPRIQSFRIPANGRYYIKARDNAGRGGTDLIYSLEVQSESYGPTPTLVQELCTDLFEPDGVPEQARLITVREVQPNHRFCPSGDADWVRFFAKAGQPYVLRVDSGVTGSDPVMILVDRDGVSILDLNDDSGGTLDPRIEFTVAVDGFYYAQLKNVGDIGNQFISYDLFFEPLGVAETAPTEVPTGEDDATPTPDENATVTPTDENDGTVTPTSEDDDAFPTPTFPPFRDEDGNPYPAPTQTVLVAQTLTALPNDLDNTNLGVKGVPAMVNRPAKDFVDPAIKQVWSRTDEAVATGKVERSWMWGPTGLQARAEVYSQSIGGARQVQYFDKARMEITDWRRNRSNQWFVTNGLLVKELIDGKLQIGDSEFVDRQPAAINVAGDSDDPNGPTYASFARHLAGAGDRTGQIATATLRRDGSTGTTGERSVARLAQYVPETGHNIPQVFWDFLNARGPVGDGASSDVLVDWVFAMGYPISEPYWAKVKVGGVEKDVLVQAFQRRVLTYTPSNKQGWQVEMGNVGRHYYQWRYGQQP